MIHLKTNKAALFVVGVFLLSLSSCATIFSEYQDARTVGKGNVDVSGNYSAIKSHSDGESNTIQKQAGVQSSYGLTNGTDLRLRYEYAWTNVENASINAHVIGIGPKFSLVKDRFSFYVPVGMAFGENIETSETIQVHPTFLATIPTGNTVDINPSVKVLIPFNESDITYAANLGLGIHLNNRLTLRPEYGIQFDFGDNGYNSHFGIGLTLNPNGKFNKPAKTQ